MQNRTDSAGPLNRLCQLLLVSDVLELARGDWSTLGKLYEPMAQCLKEKLNEDVSAQNIHSYTETCVNSLNLDFATLPQQVTSSIKSETEVKALARQYFSKLIKACPC